VIFLVENAPAKHRGFWGSFAPLGVSIGNLLAAGAFALVTLLPREDLMAWGWRLPFLASFLLIMVGIYVRLRITETPVFTQAVVARGKIERNPAMEALKRHPRNFFVVLGARLAENGLGYLFPVFGLSYVITTLGVPKSRCAQRADAGLRHRALHHCGLRHAFRSYWPPPCLYVRRVGRHRLGLSVLPAGRNQAVDLDRGGLHRRPCGGDGGDVRAAGRLFRRTVPAQRRFAGFAFARELGSLLAGGPAPFVAAALVAWSGSWWPVACYAAFLAACTAFAIWCGPETYEESITVDNTSDGKTHAAAVLQQA